MRAVGYIAPMMNTNEINTKAIAHLTKLVSVLGTDSIYANTEMVMNANAFLKSLAPSAPEAKPLHKYSIVAYKDGHFQITRLTKTHCNLAHVWDATKIRHKNVPLSEVKEDGEAFHKNWEQSEAYQSM